MNAYYKPFYTVQVLSPISPLAGGELDQQQAQELRFLQTQLFQLQRQQGSELDQLQALKRFLNQL